MNLIPISANVLVNPECISSIEQRKVKDSTVTYVYVYDKEYILQVPLEQFYQDLGIVQQSEGEQHFAG